MGIRLFFEGHWVYSLVRKTEKLLEAFSWHIVRTPETMAHFIIILIICNIRKNPFWCLDSSKSLNITFSQVKSHYDQEKLTLTL